MSTSLEYDLESLLPTSVWLIFFSFYKFSEEVIWLASLRCLPWFTWGKYVRVWDITGLPFTGNLGLPRRVLLRRDDQLHNLNLPCSHSICVYLYYYMYITELYLFVLTNLILRATPYLLFLIWHKVQNRQIFSKCVL